MTDRVKIAGELLREGVSSDEIAPDAVKRSALVEAVRRDAKRRRRFAIGASGLSVVVIVGLGLWIRSSARFSDPDFRVGADVEGRVGTYYAANSEANLPLGFSDGSSVAVSPGGGVRVTRIDRRGASVQVESGRVHFDVAHRAETRWSVAAGPYTVRVTGTAFWLAWQPARLELDMEAGSVIVTGPGIETGTVVRAGEHFVSEASAHRSAQDAPSAPLPSASSSAGEVHPDKNAQNAAPAPSEPSWGVLATHGEYARIVEAAERRGVDSVLGSGSLEEVGALADAARYTGRGGLAERALTTLRSRFASSERAKSSAFVLGRMLDDSGNASGALRWYDAYLAEAPGGALVAEVTGRRMLVLERLGRTAEAKTAAESYLHRFPKGAYAARAEELVSH